MGDEKEYRGRSNHKNVAPIAGVRYKSGNYKAGAVTEETAVRFSNKGYRPKINKQILTSGRQHCVGDFSCCGHVP